jgi:uncharacterized membrane protein (DUF373 family)
MIHVLAMFEKGIIIVLLVLMMLAVLASTFELGVVFLEQLLEPPRFLLNMEEMLEVFGFFLMVLISLELLETIKAYLEQDKVHVEIVFLVAMVAVARKMIILEYKDVTPSLLFGMSAIIISLAGSYYLVKHIHTVPAPGSKSREQ